MPCCSALMRAETKGNKILGAIRHQGANLLFINDINGGRKIFVSLKPQPCEMGLNIKSAGEG